VTLAIMFALLLAQATPSPAPSDACNHEASITKSVPPDPRGLDDNVLAALAPLSADIDVAIAPDGSPGHASVYKSSGYRGFDLAAIHAAKASTFTPQVVDCKPVESTVRFKATLEEDVRPPQ
jgi:TonB family protein